MAGTQALSADGLDMTYATNHIGPFLLTTLLLPALERAAQGRVVNVSSVGHLQAKRIDWSMLERRAAPRRSGFGDYAVSKLMNVLRAKELARRLTATRITTYALHPGGVASNIWRSVPQPFRWIILQFLISTEQGARTPLHCATAPELVTRGALLRQVSRGAVQSARERSRAGGGAVGQDRGGGRGGLLNARHPERSEGSADACE